MKKFSDLSEREILALAIALEEEDARIFADYAEGLEETYPNSAKVFREMQEEENEHRRWLIELYRERFGDHIPLIRREDVKGFVARRPIWLVRPLGLESVRKQAETIELETRRFYEQAIKRTSDASIRKLLGDLAEAEREHVSLAEQLEQEHMTGEAKSQEEAAQHRLFVLQIVQPGLAGLMDGSVSTLAPIFAAAFATHAASMADATWATFLVGLAASVGAGISMGFAEALSDDGSMTGRGRPLARGIVCGLMTTAGGIGHTLPFLIPHFAVAMAIAIIVVVLELIAISYIRYRYMDTSFLASSFQVIVGGLLVFLAGVLIGNA